MSGGWTILAMVMALATASTEAPVVPEAVLDGDPSVAEAPSPAAAADPSLRQMQPATARLFNALVEGTPSDDIDRLVAEVAAELDINCPRISEYQVYRSSSRSRTLKLKCDERPIFAVTVGPAGEGFVSGGDGSIAPMRLEDGAIRTVLGVLAEDYIAQASEATAPAGEARAAPPPPAADVAEEPPADQVPLGAFLKKFKTPISWLLAALGAWSGFRLLRRLRRRQLEGLSRWRDLDSEAKNQLIEESEEIYPDLYRHPGGVFIARGRRGKRRLFSSLVFAYLYRSQGLKLFEIR